MDLQLTIPDLFLRAVAAHPLDSALWTWHPTENRFTAKTWQALAHEVAQGMGALDALGIQRGEHIAQISENRAEWIVLDLACHFAGVVHVPLHASLSGSQLIKQITLTNARHVFFSTAEQWQKIKTAEAEQPASLIFIAYERIADSMVRYWPDLLPTTSPLLQPRSVTPETIATIMVTSGTTGDSKGVMLTQRNLSSNAQAAMDMYGAAPQELKLNVLPLSHAYARTCDLYLWLARGSQLALAESRETLLRDLQAIRPTSMNGVPYLYERLWRAVCEKKLENAPGSLRNLLGGNMRTCHAGGAPLSPALLEFFAAQQVPLLEGYGLTETSPILSISTREKVRPGSCGPLLPGVEVQIANDGEVLTRGPQVMLGYYRDEQATAQAIQNGWFHTGDLGELDADNFLYIRGRKKELIVLATGKKVVPSVVENAFVNDPLIAQIVVLGEGRNFLAALIVPHINALQSLAASHQITFSSLGEILNHAEIVSYYEAHIREKLITFSHHEQVRKVKLLPQPFSVERGELTLKLSYCRPVIARSYSAAIEALYGRDA